MNRIVKYGLVGFAVLAFLAVSAIMIVPHLFKVERYKPTIERLIAEKTGMPIQIDGEITLSLFPWIALNFSDLRLENPDDFERQPFINIRSFEARLKTLPLLSKNVEISRFVIDGPEVYLIKNELGSWNWEKPVPTPPAAPPPATAVDPAESQGTDSTRPPAGQAEPGGFLLTSLVVGEFSITNGRVVVEDRSTNLTRDISGINLQLHDASLDRPIAVELQALLDGHPLNLTGTVGPLGADPGSGPLPVNLTLVALDLVTTRVTGTLAELKQDPTYRLDLVVDPFDLRQLIARLAPDASPQTSDPKALQRMAFHGAINGTADRLELSDGSVTVDDTTITLDKFATEFAGPSIELTLALDAIDLDRYLPPRAADTATEPTPGAQNVKPNRTPGEQAGQAEQRAASVAGTTASSGPASPTAPAGSAFPPTSEPGAMNYEPLRRLTLKATMDMGTIRIHGGTLDNLHLSLTGDNGRFDMGSLTLDLYQGSLDSTGRFDVRQDVPEFTVNATLDKIQVGPLLRDFADKDVLEGSLHTVIELSASGDRPDTIKASLNGAGRLQFEDGAIIGLDLARMARTVTSGFSLDQQGERPRTDFAELRLPLSITNGLVTFSEASLQSPFIRARGGGTADLVTEALDLRLQPQLVATIKGQGDQEQRSGLTVPVLVGGSFSDPEFRPDLEALARDRLPDQQELEEIIRTGTISPERKEKLSEEVEKAKGLLKGLLGN